MSDAALDLEADNIFAVGPNFKTTASNNGGVHTNVAANDEVGNVTCQRNIEDIKNSTQSSIYCGSDFMADLVDTRTAPVSFLENFGCTYGTPGIVLTGLTINMSAQGFATVDFTGHNHLVNEHDAGATPTGATRADALSLGVADVSDFMPHEVAEAFNGWDGFGVPDFGITVGADSSPASASVTFTMNHVDVMDEQGDHLSGKNITPRCELSMDFVGIPTSNTATLLEADFDGNTNDMFIPLVDSTDENTSNSDFDTFAFAAHANTDLSTV
jgi:hypothetical protein